jgi:hypothetical protein
MESPSRGGATGRALALRQERAAGPEAPAYGVNAASPSIVACASNALPVPTCACPRAYATGTCANQTRVIDAPPGLAHRTCRPTGWRKFQGFAANCDRIGAIYFCASVFLAALYRGLQGGRFVEDHRCSSCGRSRAGVSTTFPERRLLRRRWHKRCDRFGAMLFDAFASAEKL